MAKKRLLPALLCLCVALTLLPQTAWAAGFARDKTYTPGQFTDVPENAWYAGAVKDCYEMGLMNGSSANTFSPNGMFTVAEAITVAARMHDIYSGGDGTLPAAFGAWYQGAVNYALNSGIISSDQFRDYESDITRAEMAGLMAVAMPDSQWTAKNNVTALPDVTSSTKCSDAIFKLYNAGVFAGSDEYGAFQPYACITRAEVAAIAVRCADPYQRKTLSLTPLSQMDAPEIPNFKNPNHISGRDFSMSDGLLRIQNAESEKTRRYGYMNYKGEVVIPIQYSQAGDFSDGCAIVRGDSGCGVINTRGEVIVPLQYAAVSNNGIYLIASTRTGCDIYDLEGEWLGGFDGWSAYDFDTVQDLKYADNNPLFVLEEGNKKALAAPSGMITEAVYDFIDLIADSNFAILRSGKLEALAGPNGIIFNLGEYAYSYGHATGDYVVVREAVNEYREDGGYWYAIADSTGNLTDFVRLYDNGGMHDPAVSDGKVIAYDTAWQYILYDRVTGETLSYSIVEGEVSTGGRGNFYDGGHLQLPDGRYVLLDGTLCLSVEASGVYETIRIGEFNVNSQIWAYQGLNGKYGIAFSGQRLTDSLYDSAEAAFANYGYYKKIEENGKPVIAYGNKIIGFTPVVRFYKNSVYYDEIEELGEGYYACRFNQIWHLVHP